MTEMTADELAAVVKAYRKRHGFTVARLADALGVPARTLEGIEQGRSFRHPTLLMLALQTLDQPPPRKGKLK